MPTRDSAPSDPRTKAMTTAIMVLLEALSPAERERVLRQAMDKLRPIDVPRAGGVLGAVVQLIPLDREWTVKELRQQLEQDGTSIANKELFNAVGYLTRKGHIRRLGYGRYTIGTAGASGRT